MRRATARRARPLRRGPRPMAPLTCSTHWCPPGEKSTARSPGHPTTLLLEGARGHRGGLQGVLLDASPAGIDGGKIHPHHHRPPEASGSRRPRRPRQPVAFVEPFSPRDAAASRTCSTSTRSSPRSPSRRLGAVGDTRSPSSTLERVPGRDDTVGGDPSGSPDMACRVAGRACRHRRPCFHRWLPSTSPPSTEVHDTGREQHGIVRLRERRP